jgi:hypothetical protein
MALKVYKANNFATLESDPGSTFTVPLQSAYIAAEDGTLNSIGRVKIIANESATAPDGNVYLSAYPWYSIKDRTGATAATGPASTVTYLNEIFDDPIEITDFVKPDTSSGKSETTQFVHNGDISAGGALILDTDGAKIGFQDNTYLNIEEDNTYGAGYGTLTINLENNGSTQNFLTAQMGNVYSQAVTTINVGTLQVNGNTSFTSDVELGNAASDNITVNGTLVGVDIGDLDNVATVATSGDYNDLTNTPTIPTATSDLTNDSGFITSASELDGQKIEYFTRTTAYGNGSYEGKVLKVGTATLVASKVYQYTASGWSPTDANANGKAVGLIGLALGTSESTNGLLVSGVRSSSVYSGFTAGDTLYLSETEGAITNTAPTASGSVVRIVGYALGSSNIYFDPSQEYIELS